MQFAPGDIIQPYEEPFIKYLNVSWRESFCYNCFKENETLLRCADCRKVLYCDKDCQRADWKTAHSIECKLYAMAGTIRLLTDDDSTDQVIRLLCYVKLHKESARKCVQLYNEAERSFEYLQDHSDLINKVPEISRSMRSLAMRLTNSKLFTPTETSYENILRLFGIWKINGFSLANQTDTKVIGAAVYLLCSSFDHSCRPNSIRVMDEKFRMQVHCIEAIPAKDAPMITYLAGIRNRKERQLVLKERYHFRCGCVLCEKEKHGGDVVNYRTLVVQRECLSEVRPYTDQEIITTKNIAAQMERMFGPYDERITNLYNITLARLILALAEKGPVPRKVTISKVLAFADEVEDKLRITFGEDHRDFRYFNEKVRPALREF